MNRPGMFVLNASADTARDLDAAGAAQVNRDTWADEDAVRVTFAAQLNPAALAAVGSLLYAIKQGAEVLVLVDDDFIPAVVQLAAHGSPSVGGDGGSSPVVPSVGVADGAGKAPSAPAPSAVLGHVDPEMADRLQTWFAGDLNAPSEQEADK